ncbi:MAG TPA: AMP-binding protein [Planctomycetaceae bacterium]|nr:AMP-binding protein [Planctomycetaceae bacterium]
MSDGHLGRCFAQVAANRAEAHAFSTAAGDWTYGQLLCAAEAVAARVRMHTALTPGSRIVSLLPNSPDYAAVFYGVLLAGGVVVPLPPRIEAGILQSIVESTMASLMIVDARVLKARPDLRDRPVEILSFQHRASSAAVPVGGDAQVSGKELAAIFFTGGSSGIPKGVMLSHANLISNARAIQEYLQIGASDRPLCVLPFHHAFGNSVLQSHLLTGAQLVLDGQPAFPETLIEALATRACTSVSGVPELFRRLLDRSSLGSVSLPALRYMAVAGGALPRNAALEVARRIAPAEFFVMYGQTEATARLAFVPPVRLGDAPDGAIGRAIPGVTLEVVDDADAPANPDTIGELRAKGPGVMLGYWRDPAATSEQIREGWLYTGDLAAVDSQGAIVLKGRRNSFVKIAGFRVQPSDLEEFAIRRMGVAQAVAVAYESPGSGTRLALFVRAAEAAGCRTASQAMALCRAELPGHMVPEFIQFIDEFPLNHALKIDRPLLAQWAQHEAASRRTPA